MKPQDALGIALLAAVVAILLIVVTDGLDNEDDVPTVPTMATPVEQGGIRAPTRMSSPVSSSP